MLAKFTEIASKLLAEETVRRLFVVFVVPTILIWFVLVILAFLKERKLLINPIKQIQAITKEQGDWITFIIVSGLIFVFLLISLVVNITIFGASWENFTSNYLEFLLTFATFTMTFAVMQQARKIVRQNKSDGLTKRVIKEFDEKDCEIRLSNLTGKPLHYDRIFLIEGKEESEIPEIDENDVLSYPDVEEEQEGTIKKYEDEWKEIEELTLDKNESLRLKIEIEDNFIEDPLHLVLYGDVVGGKSTIQLPT